MTIDRFPLRQRLSTVPRPPHPIPPPAARQGSTTAADTFAP
jgi:hypothetical protein